MKIPIAIFASGRGSNFDSIQSAVESGRLAAEIKIVISDKPDAPVLEKARAKGIVALCIEPVRSEGSTPFSAQERRVEHEKRILEALKPVHPRFLVMAGYMRVVTNELLDAFRSERGYCRIVNIHPSLLPAFSGVSAYSQAFQHGVKVTGVSVHLVEAEVDSGPICAQEAFGIADCRSIDEVEKRGLAVEHRLFPETLKWVLPEKFSVERVQGRFCVRPN